MRRIRGLFYCEVLYLFFSLAGISAGSSGILIKVFQEGDVKDAGYYNGQLLLITEISPDPLSKRCRPSRAKTHVYRLENHSFNSVRLDAEPQVLAEIRRSNGSREAWIGTKKGIFQLDHDRGAALRIFERAIDDEITAIETGESGTWVATCSKLYLVKDDTVIPIDEVRFESEDPIVESLKEINRELWIGREGSFQIWELSNFSGKLSASERDADADGRLSCPGKEELFFTEILEGKGLLWLLTEVIGENRPAGPVFWISQGACNRTTPNVNAFSMIAREDGPWFASAKGVHHLVNDIYLEAVESPDPVNAIWEANGNIWIGTPEKLHRMDPGEGFIPIPKVGKGLGIHGGFQHAGISSKMWAWGESGLYLHDAKSEIGVSTTVVASPSIHVGSAFEIRDVRYIDRDGGTPFAGFKPRMPSFRVVIEHDVDAFDEAVKDEANFTKPAHTARHPVPYGVNDFHVEVRDDFGNSKRIDMKSVLVLPDFAVLPAFLTAATTLAGGAVMILAWTFAIVSIWCAPNNILSMSLVDSRFFRTRGSLGLMPLLLAARQVRRHLLKRYCRHAAEVECQRVVLRKEATEDLWKKRRLWIFHDEQQQRRDYLKSVFRSVARGSPVRGDFPDCVPVYVELEIYLTHTNEDPRLDDMYRAVLGEMANFGDINDPELGHYLLDQGDFLFILDAPEGMCPMAENVVRQFVNRYGRENYFIVGSHKENGQFIWDFPGHALSSLVSATIEDVPDRGDE